MIGSSIDKVVNKVEDLSRRNVETLTLPTECKSVVDTKYHNGLVNITCQNSSENYDIYVKKGNSFERMYTLEH